jgi:hypothetical protein
MVNQLQNQDIHFYAFDANYVYHAQLTVHSNQYTGGGGNNKEGFVTGEGEEK